MKTKFILNKIESMFVNICVSICMVVILFCVSEFTVRLYGLCKDCFVSQNSLYNSHPVIIKQEWGGKYLADLDRFRWKVDYHAYVGFRESSYHSETINIDNGIRFTPFTCDKADSINIYTFGGSTMLGVGVPDNYTIPAFIAKELSDNNIFAKIVNYGSGWWQSSQSLSQLIKLLRGGDLPNIVIFYDGINDIDVVTYGGKVGGMAPYAEILLNKGIHNELKFPSIKEFIIRKSALCYSLVNRFARNYYRKDIHNECIIKEDEMEVISKKIVRTYENNVKMVQSLGDLYGFESFFFLQPFPLISKKVLTDDENKIFDTRINEKKWERQMVKTVYAEFKKSEYLKNNPRFFDISDIFDNVTDEVFVDSEHLLPNGNRVISNTILESIGIVEKADNGWFSYKNN